MMDGWMDAKVRDRRWQRFLQERVKCEEPIRTWRRKERGGKEELPSSSPQPFSPPGLHQVCRLLLLLLLWGPLTPTQPNHQSKSCLCSSLTLTWGCLEVLWRTDTQSSAGFNVPGPNTGAGMCPDGVARWLFRCTAPTGERQPAALHHSQGMSDILSCVTRWINPPCAGWHTRRVHIHTHRQTALHSALRLSRDCLH